MSVPRLALVTHKGLAYLGGERHLIAALTSHNIQPCLAPWDDLRIVWNQFDGVLLRACWNYHLSFLQFQAWLDHLDRSAVPVWNSTDLIRWNMRKNYLLDLERRGIRIIPTLVAESGLRTDLGEVMDQHGWEAAVVKPLVSADSYRTHQVHRSTAKQAQALLDFITATAAGGALIQPFMKEIESGEYSFVFIDGQYSHTILKSVKTGDFRTGEIYGGKAALTVPDSELVSEARTIAKLLPEALLYLRIDALIVAGHLAVMEVELIEPWLGFDMYPLSADSLARAVKDRLTLPLGESTNQLERGVARDKRCKAR